MKKSKKKESTFLTWDKDKEIEKILNNNRNLDWYIHRYKRNLNYSLMIVTLSLFFVIISIYQIKKISGESEVIITSTSGKIIHYEMTKEKKELLIRALKNIEDKNKK